MPKTTMTKIKCLADIAMLLKMSLQLSYFGNAFCLLQKFDEPNLCYFTADCSNPDSQLDGEPCVVGSGHCFSGVVCAGGAGTKTWLEGNKENHDKSNVIW